MDNKKLETMIGQVRIADRERVRRLIGHGVQAAQEQWIESGLIGDALILEWIKVIQEHQSGKQVAEDLRALADRVDSQYPTH